MVALHPCGSGWVPILGPAPDLTWRQPNPAPHPTNLRLGIEWDLHVVRSEKFNAFVLPSGKIFVFTGTMYY